jgi:hypothetical protein
MAYDPDSSGEYIPPKSTYLDDVPIYDAELGGIVPAWKALIYHGAKARHFAEMRNDSAGAIAAEAQKGAPSGQPRHAPPLAADSIKAKAKKDEAAKMNQVLAGLDALERRLDVLEARKRQQAEDAARAEIAEQALLLAEQIAEETPGAVMDALSPPRPKQRLN